MRVEVVETLIRLALGIGVQGDVAGGGLGRGGIREDGMGVDSIGVY